MKSSTINITLSEELVTSLIKLAEFEERSISSLAEEFIQNALEHEEDMKLYKIAYKPQLWISQRSKA